jgi:hypothetical protein
MLAWESSVFVIARYEPLRGERRSNPLFTREFSVKEEIAML